MECAMKLGQIPLVPIIELAEFRTIGEHKPPRARHPYRKNQKSVLLYDGPSMLTGDPIFVVASWGSKNSKTGNMVQTTILRADMHPVDAIRCGGDVAQCGNCKHRGDGTGKRRSCYVKLMYTFNQWRKYSRGDYDRYDGSGVYPWPSTLPIRFGTYGDPCAVPVGVWDSMLSYQTGTRKRYTGYTHQWAERPVLAEQYKHLCMASVDNWAEMARARYMGWRTFRVLLNEDTHTSTEIPCPSAKVQCAKCGLCRGNTISAKSIAIPVHGPSKRYFTGD